MQQQCLDYFATRSSCVCARWMPCRIRRWTHNQVKAQHMTQGDNNFPCDLLLRLILNCCWTPEQTVLNFSDRRMIFLSWCWMLWQGQSESCLPQFVFMAVWGLSNEMCRLQGAKPSAAQDLRLSGVFGCLPSFKGSFCCEDVDIAKVGQDGDAGDAGEAASWRLWWLFHASLVHSRNWRSFMRERRQGAKAGRNEFSVLAARKSESEDFDQVMGSMEKNSVVLYFLSGGCSHARYQFLFKDWQLWYLMMIQPSMLRAVMLGRSFLDHVNRGHDQQEDPAMVPCCKMYLSLLIWQQERSFSFRYKSDSSSPSAEASRDVWICISKRCFGDARQWKESRMAGHKEHVEWC